MADVAHRQQNWSAGDAYEPYVGRWSRFGATEFLDWLAMPVNARWLDVGCGTGALSETILDRASPRQVIGIDPAEGFIEFARRRRSDSRIEFRIGDARGLPFEDAGFDAAVAGLTASRIFHPNLTAMTASPT